LCIAGNEDSDFHHEGTKDTKIDPGLTTDVPFFAKATKGMALMVTDPDQALDRSW
jgi:hypothetical protein